MKLTQITKRMDKHSLITVISCTRRILFDGIVQDIKKDNPINPLFVTKIGTDYSGAVVITVIDFIEE